MRGLRPLTCALLLAGSSALPLAAQREVRLSAGVGGGSAPLLGTAFGNLFAEALSFGTYHTEGTRSTGARTISLSTGKEGTWIGLAFISEQMDSDIYLDDADPTPDGTQEITSTTLLYEVTRFHGGKQTHFYSTIAIGGALYHEDLTIEGVHHEDSRGAFAYQVDLLGVSVGQQLRGWGTLGLGYRGILSLGASYTF